MQGTTEKYQKCGVKPHFSEWRTRDGTDLSITQNVELNLWHKRTNLAQTLREQLISCFEQRRDWMSIEMCWEVVSGSPDWLHDRSSNSWYVSQSTRYHACSMIRRFRIMDASPTYDTYVWERSDRRSMSPSALSWCNREIDRNCKKRLSHRFTLRRALWL